VSLRDEVLAGLRQAAGEPVSGQALAVRHDVSRTAIAKHVAALRRAGYTIDAVPGSGYVLRAAPALALPAEVEPFVSDPLWVRFEGGACSESTNDDCKRLARHGAPEGTVVVAGSQSAGRGRLGRSWESPAGGAYLSVLLRPDVTPADVTALPLAVALGVATGIGSMGVACALKWPNDVMVGGRKLAGVLLEISAEPDRVEWVVAGIGANVLVPAGRYPDAAYVAEYVANATPAQVAAAVLDGVAAVYRRWLAGGFDVLAQEYEERSMLTGAYVEVRGPDAIVRGSGRVAGVDGTGRLLVESEGVVQAVSAGDVTLRADANS
jgi:BirA family biotin operon repressor/biotin-[acetyl-CoA-carboxylase] ligase